MESFVRVREPVGSKSLPLSPNPPLLSNYYYIPAAPGVRVGAVMMMTTAASAVGLIGMPGE